MPESQNIEWKQTWKEDHLKWVCGFANAHGGKLYVGIDDNGKIYPLPNTKKLLEEIPQFIRSLLGLTIDVNLLNDGKGEYIEIQVPPQPNAISYRGRYYYRSGSVKSELTGTDLNEFLLKKSGTSWDAMIEDRASSDDINFQSLATFTKDAKHTDRLPDTDYLTPVELLEKLRLTQDGRFTRAALVLFGKDPLRFFPGASIKIGRFGRDLSDLLFHDVVEGNLIQVLRTTLDLLRTKYLPRPVRFDGLQRHETFIYPLKALREVLLNAMVHRRYHSNVHIQIRVTDDQLSVWNDGPLPEELPLQALHAPHASRPRNPLIADVCFKAGYIDIWGRGIEVIKQACIESQLPAPTFEEQNGGVLVTLTSPQIEGRNLENEGANSISEGGNHENEGASIETDGAPEAKDIALILELFYLNQGLNPRRNTIFAQGHILEKLMNEPGQQAAALASVAKVSKSAVERHLAKLKEHGLVEIQGAGKSRAYYPTDKARNLSKGDSKS